MPETAAAIVEEIKGLGSESYKKILVTHGAREPVFGAKIEDLKRIQKRIKKDYRLALELYDTGVYDAMYLAGLIADDARMNREDLERWVEKAQCSGISEYTVPWVASGSPHGWDVGLAWIESKKESVAAAGWATLGCWVSVKDDAELDLAALRRLLQRVGKTIHDQPNRVRHVMNGFVIGVGSYVAPLTALALETAGEIGDVTVDMGGTACKVPDAASYIEKVRARGALGKKRKTAKC
jgi:3-methyladenine DNA glycosylase AlkD